MKCCQADSCSGLNANSLALARFESVYFMANTSWSVTFNCGCFMMRLSYYTESVSQWDFCVRKNKKKCGDVIFSHSPPFCLTPCTRADQPKSHGKFSTCLRVNYFHTKFQARLKLFTSRFASRLKGIAVAVDFL